MQSLREECVKVFSVDKKTSAHTQRERIHECISSFSFGHRNKSRWQYPGGDRMYRSAWKFIIQLPRLTADKHAHFGFVLLASEHFTSGAQFHSSQVLLEKEAE